MLDGKWSCSLKSGNEQAILDSLTEAVLLLNDDGITPEILNELFSEYKEAMGFEDESRLGVEAALA